PEGNRGEPIDQQGLPVPDYPNPSGLGRNSEDKSRGRWPGSSFPPETRWCRKRLAPRWFRGVGQSGLWNLAETVGKCSSELLPWLRATMCSGRNSPEKSWHSEACAPPITPSSLAIF